MSTGRPAVSLAAVLVTTVAIVAVSAPAHAAPKAAPTCYAGSCFNLDPIETHCVDDAVTIGDAVLDGRIVRLRYSAQCRAAWAQLWYGKPGDRAYVRSEDDNGTMLAVTSTTVMPGDGNSVYSPMVDDKGVKARACVELPSLPAESGTACTISY